MASFLEFCSSCCTEYKVYRGHRQWLFFKHFLGSNRANLKAFVRRTGRLGKEKEAESYISDFFLQIINGCLTPPPSPPFPLRRSAVWLNYAVIKIVSFCRWEVPSLVSSVEPKIVATRAESSDRCFVVFYQSEQGQQLFPSVIPHTKTFPPRVNKDQKCFPWYFNFSFFPFFLFSFWCLCWNPTPQKDVLLKLNSKYFFNEYWCAWLHFLSSYAETLYHPKTILPY